MRKSFGRFGERPKILIVTVKLLTGFDAPILYALYLDKPMRDHTLLQAIARVNRPYENEAREMVKPHGFVLDFVGIFDKLEKALAFDSDEVEAIIKDIRLLKVLFQTRMTEKAPEFLKLIGHNFDDRDVDYLIEHFRDQARRKELFKAFKEIEMLYEVISPDAFLRPFMDDFATIAAIYHVVRKAYTKTVYVDRAFQRKTDELVQKRVGTAYIQPVDHFLEINEETVDLIVRKKGGDGTKVINLVKSIAKSAEAQSDDPLLIAMAERARAVQERFEQRQLNTREALAELLGEVQSDQARKKEQAAKGFDGLTFFVYRTLLDYAVPNAEAVSAKIKAAFVAHPNWRAAEKALRDLRQAVTFAVYAEVDDLYKVTTIVEKLFSLIHKAYEIG